MTNVFIIGSLAQEDKIRKVAETIERNDRDKSICVEYVKKEPEKTFQECVESAFARISNADIILAIEKPEGGFGNGTTYEIAYARALNKVVLTI